MENNALKRRSFTSLAEQNLFLSDWERTVPSPTLICPSGSTDSDEKSRFVSKRPNQLNTCQ